MLEEVIQENIVFLDEHIAAMVGGADQRKVFEHPEWYHVVYTDNGLLYMFDQELNERGGGHGKILLYYDFQLEKVCIQSVGAEEKSGVNILGTMQERFNTRQLPQDSRIAMIVKAIKKKTIKPELTQDEIIQNENYAMLKGTREECLSGQVIANYTFDCVAPFTFIFHTESGRFITFREGAEPNPTEQQAVGMLYFMLKNEKPNISKVAVGTCSSRAKANIEHPVERYNQEQQYQMKESGLFNFIYRCIKKFNPSRSQ